MRATSSDPAMENDVESLCVRVCEREERDREREREMARERERDYFD